MSDARVIAAALAKLNKIEKQESFDPAQPGSKATPGQLSFLKDIGRYKHRVIRGGNRSGKGITVAREIAWILTESHPYWKRPSSWTEAPLLILVVGQDRKMMEIELWDKKLAMFLDLSEWRQVRVGGSLQYVENRQTGDKVVFLSHNDSSDKNRKHIQGYTANYVWLDEMPSSVTLLQEIRTRASANGYFVASFTPKFRSEEVKLIMDSIEPPLGKTYRIGMLENPVFHGKEDELHAELAGYGENYRRAVLFGDWYAGDTQVYEWKPDFMEAEPFDYNRSWRHVLSVDPALKSKFGFTLWAEEPSTGIWFLVRDDYVEGIFDPESIFQEVEKRISGYNVVRRICDPHEAWYIGTASKNGVSHICPFDKANRKNELIKNFQGALSSGKIKIAPWCTAFKSEIQSCHWSETTDKMINSSSYHALDCAQYFVDCKPKYDEGVIQLTWHEALRRKHAEKEKAKALTAKLDKGRRRVRPVGSWGHRRVKLPLVGE